MEKANWKTAWSYHRQELGLWIAAIILYLLFVRETEPSRYTFIISAMAFGLPPVIVARFLWTALWKK